MASFMFDEYIKSVGHNTTNVPVPITETSGVGICLITDGDPLTPFDIFGEKVTTQEYTKIETRIAVDETDGIKAIKPLNTTENHIWFVDVPSDYSSDPQTKGYTMIKSHSIKFGVNTSVTTIKNVVGAVVFAYSGSDIPGTLNETNAIPVCYLDFGGTVDSSAGPFKVVFKNGVPDQEDDTTTVPESYGEIYRMK